VSLLAKLSSARIKDAHVLLLLAKRTESSLVVDAGWRVYLSDVTLSETPATPLSVLRAFVDKYGVDLRVGDQAARNSCYTTSSAEDLGHTSM
jgi:hypothetical protein